MLTSIGGMKLWQMKKIANRDLIHVISDFRILRKAEILRIPRILLLRQEGVSFFIDN